MRRFTRFVIADTELGAQMEALNHFRGAQSIVRTIDITARVVWGKMRGPLLSAYFHQAWPELRDENLHPSPNGYSTRIWAVTFTRFAKEVSMSDNDHPQYSEARALGASLDTSDDIRRSTFFHWMNQLRKRTYATSSDRSQLRRWVRRSSLEANDFAEAWNSLVDNSALDVISCSRCERVEFDTDSHHVGEDADLTVCQDCFSYYSECDSCNQYKESEGMTRIEGYGSACDDCIQNDRIEASACDSCQHYYLNEYMFWDEDRDAYYCNEHAERSRCAPAHLEFDFPALCTPQKAVSNDEVIPITVAHGDVSDTGIGEIIRMVYNKTGGKWGHSGVHLSEITDEEVLAHEWQNKEGNFPKRLAKHLLVEHSLKLTEDFMAEIGTLAKNHAGSPGTHYISITRNLNLSADEFFHGGSCWWGSESYSRCELKAWHGFGVRTWSTPTEDGHPVSRAWLIPLNISKAPKSREDRDDRTKAGGRGDGPTGEEFRFTATHVLPADAYILFNSYGNIEQLPYGRMIASMVGKSYRKVGFGAEMYINSGGILIAEQSVCDSITSVGLDTRRTCDSDTCGRR